MDNSMLQQANALALERQTKVLENDEQQRIAERNKEDARIALDQWTLKAVEIVVDIMQNGLDNNEKLRAAEMIFSRTISKIAAKHIEEDSGAIDSADTAAMRDEIESLINKAKERQ